MDDKLLWQTDRIDRVRQAGTNKSAIRQAVIDVADILDVLESNVVDLRALADGLHGEIAELRDDARRLGYQLDRIETKLARIEELLKGAQP